MPHNTIDKIKSFLQTNEKLSFEQTEQLSALLDQLQSELATLPQGEKNQALEIAKLTEKKVEMSRMQDPQEADFTDLEEAIVKYEVSHPRLTGTVRSICNLLSSIGI